MKTWDKIYVGSCPWCWEVPDPKCHIKHSFGGDIKPHICIYCPKCGAQGPQNGTTLKEAIEIWNDQTDADMHTELKTLPDRI